MTGRRGKSEKGPAGLWLTDGERDRLPVRILNRLCRSARLFSWPGSREGI